MFFRRKKNKDIIPTTLPEDFGKILAELHGSEKQDFSWNKSVKLSLPARPRIDPSSDCLEIGTYYKGEGIYAGTWEPKEIGETFNLFAAKGDLKNIATYSDTVRKVQGMKFGNSPLVEDEGIEGLKIASFFKTTDYNQEKLLEEIDYGMYSGEWFIPTFDMLVKNISLDLGKITMKSGTLFDLKDTGDFKGTFNKYDIYWSCTPHFHNDFKSVHFSKGNRDWGTVDNSRFSTRLVRVISRRNY